jgi:hypothetical protein
MCNVQSGTPSNDSLCISGSITDLFHGLMYPRMKNPSESFAGKLQSSLSATALKSAGVHVLPPQQAQIMCRMHQVVSTAHVCCCCTLHVIHDMQQCELHHA